ncbi:MerR family transcriptional regulator [Rhodobium gokarnense]|uniref:DNA-binding transcriptional MerR regulator n=1 Tax=Rhodobium gokarnense TaxID=364296 RepID=A0ABT3HHV0_9HYPH|nr:MerR family transcriptional regulator [Rhodobium gokarnense]MCW2309968.1 DNA-binding transcriptional MerR regulator [Rhodobium gokarnense]
MEKSPDAFRTISEVAGDLDLPQHVLRFWETRFSQIKPMKRGGGRRYYRPDDVELLRGIRHLLYDKGYTIKGVQRILREQGIKFVMQSWHDDAEPLPVGGPSEPEIAPAAARKPERPAPAKETPRLQVAAEAPKAPEVDRVAPSSDPLDGMDFDDEDLPRDLRPGDAPARPEGKGGFGLMGRLRGERDEDGAAARLSRDDVRRLQATLFELLEIKRLLDQAR